MSGRKKPEQDDRETREYEIRIHGHLDDRWAAWFEDLTLTREEDGDTLIRGTVIDQAALFGLLRIVRDAGMLLISVNRVTARLEDKSSDKSE